MAAATRHATRKPYFRSTARMTRSVASARPGRTRAGALRRSAALSARVPVRTHAQCSAPTHEMTSRSRRRAFAWLATARMEAPPTSGGADTHAGGHAVHGDEERGQARAHQVLVRAVDRTNERPRPPSGGQRASAARGSESARMMVRTTRSSPACGGCADGLMSGGKVKAPACGLCATGGKVGLAANTTRSGPRKPSGSARQPARRRFQPPAPATRR
jgi:hypothetical protein